MNKEQKTQLIQKMKRWDWTTKKAQNDPVLFVLDKALNDYINIIGSTTGAPSYLAQALKETQAVMSAEELVQTVLDDASEAVREAFDVYPENHVAHLLGEELATRISTVDTDEVPTTTVINDLTNPAHLNLDSLKPVMETVTMVPAGWVVAGEDEDEEKDLSESGSKEMLEAMSMYPPVSANEANRLYYSQYKTENNN
jgi:hypothetical protein